jgi:gliding motility-associated-like protein
MMRKLKYIGMILLFVAQSVNAQLLDTTLHVISSGGDYDSTATVIISSTIGETVVETFSSSSSSSVTFTQGFQQTFTNGRITVDITTTGPLCQDRSNGFASISNIEGCIGPYTINWSNGNTGSFANNLAAGQYTVQVSSFDGCNNIFSFEVENTNDLPCLLKFYTGITPNGDGVNDTWEIDNIELFLNNTVDIYNRLGNKVWEGSDYDNTSTVWSGENLSGGELPSDTYFYVFIAGSNVEKGWIELTR